MSGPVRPPEAPSWIEAPHPWDRAEASPPGSPPRHPSARPSARLVAAIVALGLLGVAVGSRVGGPSPLRPTVDAAPAPAPATPPSTAAEGAPPSTAAGAAPLAAGIVDVETTSSITDQQAAGTGMVLTAGGDILTNNHVVAGATDIQVVRTDTGARYDAVVVGVAPEDDIALLRVEGVNDLPVIPIDRSADVAVGDPVIAAGNAGGRGGAPTVVTGVVQALGRTIEVTAEDGTGVNTLRDLIQTSAPLEPGDSGGPLFDADRQVIGVNTAASAGRRFDSGPAEGFAIPIATALTVVERIRTGVETATIHIGVRGFLGVATIGSVGGARVTAVEPGSPAQRAGLPVGAVVTAVDDVAIGSAAALIQEVRTHRPGDRVTVTWTAGGAPRTATVTLATGAAD